jgi:hypothetical protein
MYDTEFDETHPEFENVRRSQFSGSYASHFTPKDFHLTGEPTFTLLDVSQLRPDGHDEDYRPGEVFGRGTTVATSISGRFVREYQQRTACCATCWQPR